jgi:putative endonuclease
MPGAITEAARSRMLFVPSSPRAVSGDPWKRRRIMDRQPCVYMLASQRNGTLYIGVTSNLVKRTWEHKSNFVEGFTKMYKVHNLVWYEVHDTIESAIQREKALKKWRRKWKIGMIESFNPEWTDLYESII